MGIAEQISYPGGVNGAHELVEVGPYVVSMWLHDESDPPRDFFTGVIEEIARKNFTPGRLRNIVVTDGGAPDTNQRKQLIDTAWHKRQMKLSVVTNVLSNPLKRGVATALSWLNPHIHFFAPDRFQAALAHLDLEPHAREVWDVFVRLQREMKPNTNLGLIAAASGYPRPASRGTLG